MPTPYMPIVAAHRGARSTYPENSLASFKEAINIAMKHPNVPMFLEMDVRHTSDNELIIHHDPSTKRMAGRDVLTTDMSSNHIASLPLKPHADIWQHPTAQSVGSVFFTVTAEDMRIPRLDEVMALVDHANLTRAEIGLPLGMAMELKAEPVSLGQDASFILRDAHIVEGTLHLPHISHLITPENKTITPLADMLNSRAEAPHSNTPMMVFSTNSIGKRDMNRMAQALSPAAHEMMDSHSVEHPYPPALQNLKYAPSMHTVRENIDMVLDQGSQFYFLGNYQAVLPEALQEAHPRAPTELTSFADNPDQISHAFKGNISLIATNYPEQLAQAIEQHYVAKPRTSVSQTEPISVHKMATPNITQRQ